MLYNVSDREYFQFSNDFVTCFILSTIKHYSLKRRAPLEPKNPTGTLQDRDLVKSHIPFDYIPVPVYNK